ncbi:MAG: mitochondrial fission ELM1 family protein [Thermomonas sp.]
MTSTYALHDGRAGNARQALALARALDAAAGEWPLIPGPLARWLAPRTWPLLSAPFGPRFRANCEDPPGLAIGCGRQAALATRLLRTHGSRVVQILDPRIDPRHWDVVVAPEHDGLHGDNVVTMLGSLHPLDDLWLAQSRREFNELAALPSPHTVLLVGGPTRHASLGNTEFQSLLRALCDRTRNDGGSFSVVASRRTPPSWRDAIGGIASELPGIRWRGDQDGRNPYAGLLGHADRIVCTPDSVNMLSEAAATLVPVFAWAPRSLHGRPRQFLAALLARGRIQALDQEYTMPPFVVEPLRETARIAAEIRRRLALPG